MSGIFETNVEPPSTINVTHRLPKYISLNSSSISPSINASTSMNTDPPYVYTIYDKRQKALIVLLISYAATFSGFASNIYFPSLSTLAADFNVSVELIDLTVTTYLIFQGLAPSVWGPISDVKGRRLAYVLTFTVFIGACVGLARARTYATLVILRCVQSAGSASTIAIGSGVIGDITTREDRGGFMGIFQAGLLAPTAIGPVIGGALAGSLGWRSIFWFLVINAGAFLVVLILLLPETLRSVVGNGGRSVKGARLWIRHPLAFYQKTSKVPGWSITLTEEQTIVQKKKIDMLGPVRLLIAKETSLLIFFVAVHYAVWQMGITAMSSLFASRYGLSETQIGLTFIANGAGCIAGTFVTGKLLDLNYRRLKVKRGDKDDTSSGTSNDLKTARLQMVPLFSLVQCAAVLVFGWTLQYPTAVSIAVPIITTFFSGWTAIGNQSTIMTYVVDIYPSQSAAASASVNLARCLSAAVGTSVVLLLIDKINTGWTFTICVGAQLLSLLCILIQLNLLPAKWQNRKRNELQTQP